MTNIRAMVLMIIAMACFATADGIIKLLAQTIAKGQIMAGMGLSGAVVFGLICQRNKTPVFTRLFFHRVIVLRNVSEVTGALCLFTAFTLLPLSTVAAIIQAVPLVITATAALFLGEQVGARRWIAVFIGFIGVLVIIRPDSTGFDYGLILAIIGTLSLAMRDLASRVAPKEASNALLAFYAFSGLIPAGLAMSLFGEGFKPIDLTSAAWLFVMNIFALGGYFCVTKAMRMGEVSAVSPLRYTRLPFAAVVGYLLFAEVPDSAALIGSALIIGSGLFVMIRETKISRTQQEA